ncbi:hypothetical protein [Pseudomonas kilonensis]
MSDLEELKGVIVKLMEAREGGFEGADWVADYSLNWDAEFLERFEEGRKCIAKALESLEREDDVGLIVAIILGRTRFLDLSNFFRDIYDDLDVLVKHPSWPKIPDDYRCD